MTIVAIGFDADQDCSRVAVKAYQRGARFVCRYLKNLTKAEIAALHKAGLAILPIFETTAQRALAGGAAGKTDGIAASHQAVMLGFPPKTVIAMTADFDEQHAQDSACLAYVGAFQVEAAAAHFGASLYGNGALDDAALSHHLASFGWLAGGSGMRGTKVFAASGKAGIIQGVGDKWPSVIPHHAGMPTSLNLGISIDFDVALLPLDQLGMWMPA